MQRQRWVRAGVWLVCSGAVLAGCSKKPSATATPEPLSSASAAAATALSNSKPEPEKPKPALSYRLGHHFDGAVTFFPLVKGVLACIDCDIGTKPNDDRHVFFFDGKDVKELPGLLSDKRISANIGESVTKLLKPFDGGRYTFSGTGPNQLELQVYGWLDDGSGGRQGYPHEERYLSFDGKSWQMGMSNYEKGSGFYGRGRPYGPPDGLQRKYDNARLHGEQGVTVASEDGPLLQIVGDRQIGGPAQTPHVAIWDGKAWQRHDAAWDSTFVVQRLAGGRTLVVADNGVYGIDAKGVASPVALEDAPLQGRDIQLLSVAGEPWLISPRNVYLPDEPNVRVGTVPPREPGPTQPPPPAPDAPAVASAAPSASVAAVASAAPSASIAAVASAVPSASVAAAASAVPSASVAAAASAAPSAAPNLTASAAAEPARPGIPAMTGFSASCKTPFVVLFTPPQPHWNYYDAIHNFVDAAPQQDSLWFAEFTRNEVTYFGAQAADEAAARALMAAYVAKVPKAKPVLGCLDVKAYLPDPYTPKWDAQRLLINIASGQIL